MTTIPEPTLEQIMYYYTGTWLDGQDIEDATGVSYALCDAGYIDLIVSPNVDDEGRWNRKYWVGFVANFETNLHIVRTFTVEELYEVPDCYTPENMALGILSQYKQIKAEVQR